MEKKMMKAAVLRNWNDMRIEDVPIPEISSNEVLCRVKACGICGTDKLIMAGIYADKGWPRQLPYIQGHEWAGEIVAVGEHVDPEDFKIGDRVVGESHVYCGKCPRCLEGRYHLCIKADAPDAFAKGYYLYGHDAQGTFAEYAKREVQLLYKIPDGVSWDEAAIGNQAAVALHIVERAQMPSAAKVAIIGPGHLGLLSLQFAKALGAAKTILVGRNEKRLELGRKLGADEIVDTRKADAIPKIKELTDGLGVDVVLECAGTPEAVEMALGAARKGGRVVLAGMTGGEKAAIDPDLIVLKELDIVGSHARVNTQTQALEMIAKGQIDAQSVATHKFPLEKFNEAMETFKDKDSGALRVIIHP
ncbi:MAG: zinc-dependent alcohol dehydrogenase [Peptococcaceae bacterium]